MRTAFTVGTGDLQRERQSFYGMVNWRTSENRFLASVFLLLTVWMVSLIFSERLHLSDFKVYYGAARDYMKMPVKAEDFGYSSHDGVVYGKPFGLPSGNFKYAPFVIFLFVPLALLPWKAAAIAHFIISSMLIILLLRGILHWLRMTFTAAISFNKPVSFLFLLILIAGVHFYRELWLGNINTVLVLTGASGWHRLRDEKPVSGGFLIGLAVAIKPHFSILIPLLLFAREGKALAGALAALIALLLLPLPFAGFDRGWQLTGQWLSTMKEHNSLELLTTHPYCIYNSIYTVFGLNTVSRAGILAVLALGGTGFLFWYFFRNPSAGNRDFTMLTGFLLMAVIPDLVLTDSEHFLFSLPLIGFLLADFSGLHPAMKFFTLIGLLLYGGNWHDLWGRDVSQWIEKAGLLGYGNLLLVMAAMIHLRSARMRNLLNRSE